MYRLLFVSTLALSPAVALAEVGIPDVGDADAGPDSGPVDMGPAPDGGGGPCDGLGPVPSCEGDTVAYCDEGQPVRADCTAAYPGGRCRVVDSAFGAACAVPPGSGCLATGPGGLEQLFCQGAGAGCVETQAGATCAEDVGACTGHTGDVCVGQRLKTGCLVNQPYLVDCPAFGGACEAGACVGLPSGALCDGATLRCGEGLLCGALGVCERTASVDAGALDAAGPRDSGGGAGVGNEEDDGCTCLRASALPPFGLLLLAFAAVWAARPAAPVVVRTSGRREARTRARR